MLRYLGLLVIVNTLASPITNPLKADGDIAKVIPEYFDSKTKKDFHTLFPNGSIVAQELVSSPLHSQGNVEFKLRWATTVGSPIYATPVLFPSSTTGKKQIFASTFYQFAELLDSDGFKSWGWPLSFEDSSFQSSPVLYDVDGDGCVDMGIVDKNGNLFWVRIGEYGEYLEDFHIQVPKLKIKRDWAQGLDSEFVDRYVRLSMFDHSGSGRGPRGEGEEEDSRKPIKAQLDALKSGIAPPGSPVTLSNTKAAMAQNKASFGEGAEGRAGGGGGEGGGAGSRRRRLSEDGEGEVADQGEGGSEGMVLPDFGEGDGPGPGDAFGYMDASAMRWREQQQEEAMAMAAGDDFVITEEERLVCLRVRVVQANDMVVKVHQKINSNLFLLCR
jgi:hypothetical protein